MTSCDTRIFKPAVSGLDQHCRDAGILRFVQHDRTVSHDDGCTLGKGDATLVVARIPMERMESAGIRGREAAAGPRVFAGFLAGLEGFERTTENRGVPGSSPGLAIRQSPMPAQFTGFRSEMACRRTGPD